MQQTNLSRMRAEANARMWAELFEGTARSIALTVEVFLHRGFGSRYVGCGFMGVVLIYLFSLWFPVQENGPLHIYMAIYGVVWLMTGISTMVRQWRGQDFFHSLYTGRPTLWRLLPSWKEQNVKHLEAVLMMLLGLGIGCFSRPLGDYLMIAAFLVLLRGYSLRIEQKNRVVDMNDAVIEQQLIAEEFRARQEQANS